MLAYNIATDMENTAQEILDERENKKENKSKKPKKVNKNIVIGIIKEELVEIAVLPDAKQQEEKLKTFIEEMSRKYTQPSTVKSPRKPKRVYSAKNRTNNRKSY